MPKEGFTHLYIHETFDYDIWRMIDIAHMFLGNMLHVCFLYIKFSTYEFIAKNNFLTVVCAKGGFYSPLYETYDFDIWHMFGK